MLATLFTATLLSAFSVSRVLADEFAVPTPSLNQCQSATLTWSGGVQPFDVAIVSANDPCDTVLADLGAEINAWTIDYTVNITAGTAVEISIIDANNEEAWSGTVTIGDGDSSCLTNSTSSASESASASADSDATTLLLTSTFSTDSVAKTASSAEASGTIVGAANAGTLGTASGALSIVPMSAAATVFASLIAVGAALVL